VSRFGLLGITLILAACGQPPSPKSNIAESDEEAKKNLELRLSKTDEVKGKIKAIKDVLGPVEAFLSDITKALNAKIVIDGKPGDRVQTYLDVLQKILREATKGMVEFRKDGSWILTRPLSLPPLSEQFQCKESEISLVGTRRDNREELEIFVRDCSPQRELKRILLAQLGADDTLDVVLKPEAMASLFWKEVKSDQCDIKIEKGRAEVHCKPIEIKTHAFTVTVDPLDFVTDSRGTDATIRLLVRNSKGEFIAQGDLEARPGRPTYVAIRIK